MKSPLRVLQVISAPSRVEGQTAGITGPERRAASLAPLWASLGIEVFLLYPQRGALRDCFLASGCHLEDFELMGKFDFGAIGRLLEHINKTGAKIIHTQGAAALDMMAVAAARRGGIASVVTRPVLIDDLSNRTAMSRRIFNAVDRAFTLRLCDALVTISENGHRRMAARVPKERLHLIRNGIVSPFNHPPIRTRDKPVQIGMVGHLRDYKGFDVFLKVARSLVELGEEVTFHIVGEGPERVVLQRLCDQLNLNELVFFHGLLRDVSSILAKLDIFLFTSRREGLSMAVIEAMGAGLPIIATDVGGIADQIDSGINGEILPKDDVAALAEATLALVRDPTKRKTMGTASRSRFERYFSQDRMLAEYVKLYREFEAGPAIGRTQ